MSDAPQPAAAIRRAMILAAGRGERMRPLTDDRPKPLLQVGGKSLIEYHLDALRDAGIPDVVINTAWQGQKLRDALGPGERYGVQIRYSDEGSSALETGGGIFRALPYLAPGPFLVVNGDIWTDWRLDGRFALGAQDLAHLVLVPNPEQHPNGDFSLKEGRVTEGDTPRFTFSGIGVYRAEFFAGCQPGAFPLLPLFKRAIAAGRVGGELHSGRWFDIGTPARLAMLDAQLRASGQS
ncbi:MAG: N-acetylmuramate alpha-1-phosphate uridylyltransferase MurU [Steroidobacteraceae bacterium]